MSDLIERKKAIEALGERPLVWTDDNQYALGERNQYDMDRLAIETLPSAQPERISDPDRVYDELSKVYNMKDLSDEVYSIIGDLMLSLHEPERKKGKWIVCDNGYIDYVKCNQCGHVQDYPCSFCQDCGADMREDQDG